MGGYWQLGRGGGAARNPLLPHAYLKGVCVCLGAWGYRGMYAIIAISRLCREESLQGLKDQRRGTPFNSAWDKKFGADGATAPAPLCFKTRRGGRGPGGVLHTRTGPGCTPPPPRGPGPCLQRKPVGGRAMM